ncbi:hypothetical protein GQ600_20146 [Phytophthora cactorum]|nr:hypothetical protein GQ600_20146 [Phytophthora cactorum]
MLVACRAAATGGPDANERRLRTHTNTCMKCRRNVGLERIQYTQFRATLPGQVVRVHSWTDYREVSTRLDACESASLVVCREGRDGHTALAARVFRVNMRRTGAALGRYVVRVLLPAGEDLREHGDVLGALALERRVAERLA